MYCASGSPLVIVADQSGICASGSVVLLSQTEYDAVSIAPTLNAVFRVPSASEAAGAWAAGFILPMSIALIAMVIAPLVNFFNERNHDEG
jgi:hypothetical protein